MLNKFDLPNVLEIFESTESLCIFFSKNRNMVFLFFFQMREAVLACLGQVYYDFSPTNIIYTI